MTVESKLHAAFPEMKVKGWETHNQVLTVIGACVCMLISILFSVPFIGYSSVLAPAIILSVYSLYAFIHCGGKTVNATSVASYGTLMFIGFPAVYGGIGLYSSMKAYTPRSLLVVILLAFLFQTVIILANRKSLYYRNIDHQKAAFISGSPAVNSLKRLSIIMLLAATLTHLLGVSYAASGFSWIAILTAAILTFCTREIALIIQGLVTMIVAFIVANGLSLGGFGRLNLAVLALSVVVIASVGLQSWIAKTVVILMTGPALLFLVNQRMEFLQSERGGPVQDSEGIGSVVGPFHSAGTIVEAIQQGNVGLAWGATLFAAAVVWIPRAIWPDKPIGFGREIVEVTQPWQVASEGHSDAGTFIGEAVWNFGVWGAPVYLLLLILFIKYLDRKLDSLAYRKIDYTNLIVFIMVALLAGSLLNIIWGSSFTGAARSLFPGAVLAALWFMGNKRIFKNLKSTRVLT